MSTTNTTSAAKNENTAAKTKKFSKYTLYEALATFGLLLVVAFAGWGMTFIAYDAANHNTSFWFGLTVPYVVAIAIVALILAVHHWTSFRVGVTIAVITFIAAPGVLIWIYSSIGRFEVSNFGWGIVVAIISAILFAVIWQYGRLTHHLKSQHANSI